jgi:hypothetical protein
MHFIEFCLIDWVGNVTSSEVHVHAGLELYICAIHTDNQQTIILTLLLASATLLELSYTENDFGANEII